MEKDWTKRMRDGDRREGEVVGEGIGRYKVEGEWVRGGRRR
jgi:hypothetical protein